MPSPARDLEEWRASLVETRDRVLTLVSPLSAVARSRAPSPGAWSVDQVLEHVAIMNTLYLESMKAAVAAHGASTGTPGEWKPTLFGRLLRNAVDPAKEQRQRSPKRSRPGPTVSAGVLERFLAGVDEMLALIDRVRGVDLRRVRFSSPFAKIIRLNLGDGFAVCAAHAARHAGQIQRTINAVPKGT